MPILYDDIFKKYMTECPTIKFAEINGVALEIEVDLFSSRILWSVKEGENNKSFCEDFDSAAEYFVKRANELLAE